MTQILLKRSATSGNAPSSLGPGEVALNLADGTMYWGDNSGNVQGPAPLKNVITQSLLTSAINGVLGSNPPANLNTIAALAAAIGGDASFATDTATSLGNRLRVDAAQTFTAAQAAQARFNLGISTPLKIAAATTLDPNLGIAREYEFMGAYTVTAPAASAVFDGWRTGNFHNRGNGSITTATFVGTIAVPSGAYLNGVLNGTLTLAYGQKGYLYYDAQATPNATWRFQWYDRCPLLLTGSWSAVASVGFAMPSGYRAFEIIAANYVPSSAGGNFAARLSSNGGSSFRTGASDYLNELFNAYGSSSAAQNPANNYLLLGSVGNPSYATSRASLHRITMESAYGGCISYFGGVNSAPTQASGTIHAAQNEGGSAQIAPNYVLFFPSAGGTMSLGLSIQGIPAQ